MKPLEQSDSPEPKARVWRYVLIAIAAVGVLCGFLGYAFVDPFWKAESPWSALDSFFDAIFGTMLLFVLDADIVELSKAHDAQKDGNPWPLVLLNIARVFVAIAVFGTVFRLGFLLLQGRYQRLRLNRLSGHKIIVGTGIEGQAFARDLIQSGETVVVVNPTEQGDSDPTPKSSLPHLVTIAVDAQDQAGLQLAGLAKASGLIITCPDDATSLRVLQSAIDSIEHDNEFLASGRTRPFAIYIHLHRETLLRELNRSEASLGSRRVFEIRAFTLAELVARKFFAEESLFACADLLGQRRLHAVFVGFNAVAQHLLLQLLRLSPFRDFSEPRITILDTDARQEIDVFRAAFPEIDKIADLSPLDWSPGNRPLPERTMEEIELQAEATAIFVCLGDDGDSAATALQLRTDTSRAARLRAPIFVHQTRHGGLDRMLRSTRKAKRFVDVVQPFGLVNSAARFSGLIGEDDWLARHLHEAYLEKKGIQKSTSLAERAPNDLPWTELAETYRDANRRAADHIPIKLASVGFHFSGGNLQCDQQGLSLSAEELEHLATLEHQSWAIDRQLDGWRYGKERDNSRLFHPSLVPYEKLDRATQDLDRDQVNEVLTSIPRAKDKDDVTLFRNFRIGLIGTPGPQSPDQIDKAHREFVRRLPNLRERLDGSFTTIFSSLSPGIELAITKSLTDYLVGEGLRWRLIVLSPAPTDLTIEAWRASYEKGASWDGATDKNSTWERERAALRNGRKTWLGREETEWEINLTPPGSTVEDWQNSEAQEATLKTLVGYINKQTDLIIGSLEAIRRGGIDPEQRSVQDAPEIILIDEDVAPATEPDSVQ